MKDGKSGAVKEGADSEPESQVTVVVEGAPGVETRAVAEAKSLKEAAVQARASSADRRKGTSTWEVCKDFIWVLPAAFFSALLALAMAFTVATVSKEATLAASGEGDVHIVGYRVACGILAVGFGSFSVLLLLIAIACLIAGLAALLLAVSTCAGVKWQGIDYYFLRATEGGHLDWAYHVVLIFAALYYTAAVGSFLVWAYTSIYLAFSYCAQEALGKGDEHAKGMYAVYALLALGCVTGALALAWIVFVFVGQGVADCTGAKWRHGVVVDRARHFYLCLGLSLFLSTVCIFLAALVVWLGTGIYVAFSYCANEAVGQGGEHVQGIYAVYALLALGIVMGVFAVVYLVAYVVADATLQFNRAIAPPVSKPTGEKSQPEPQGVAAKARGLFGALASTLLKSTGGVFLAALVVWAGTGIYVLVSGRAH